MIRFAHPEMLWLLVLAPVWVAALVWSFRKRRSASFAVVGPSLLDRIAYNWSRTRSIWKASIWVGAWILLSIGAANPQIGTKLEELKREGIDIVIAVDVSNSMLSEDVEPSRLARAKHTLQRFISGLNGDRVGLVAFAGSAILHCPLTTDYGAAKLLVRVIEPELVSEQGTAISEALLMAKRASDQEGGSRVIIVVSDGEDHEAQALETAKRIAEAGVRIYTIGMGTPQGAPVPITDPRSETSDFKRDRSGTVVVTRLNEMLLRQVAEAGGGEYFRATQGGAEWEAIWDDIARMEKRELGRRQFTAFENRFQYIVLPGLIILLAEFFVGERKSRWWMQLKPNFKSVLKEVSRD